MKSQIVYVREWMNDPPIGCVHGSRAQHVGSKFLWFHGRAAMMAFCITRSTCKVSKLFYCICDWVSVNKNNGNELESTNIRLVPVSDGPGHGKVVFKLHFMLALPYTARCQLKCLSFHLGRGPSMRASKCLFSWLRNCRIFPTSRRSTGQFLRCHREWKRKKNV